MFAGRLLALSSATISGASPALIARGACANHSTCERHCLPMIRISHLGLPTRAPPRALAQRFDLFQTI